MTGTLIGVGVGPGDPDLLTIKGRRVLRGAEVVFVPVADSSPAGRPGHAERVVAAHTPPTTTVTRLPFALAGDGREAGWRRAAATVAATVSAGHTAAFATLGDPAVYSTFTYLAREVRALVPGVTVTTVPGITAMQELAARRGVALAERDEPLTLLPVTAGLARVRRALADRQTLVLYKGGRWLPELRELLAAAGALPRALYGARLGHASEEVGALAEVAGLPPGAAAPYMSTVIVPPVREES